MYTKQKSRFIKVKMDRSTDAIERPNDRTNAATETSAASEGTETSAASERSERSERSETATGSFTSLYTDRIDVTIASSDDPKGILASICLRPKRHGKVLSTEYLANAHVLKRSCQNAEVALFGTTYPTELVAELASVAKKVTNFIYTVKDSDKYYGIPRVFHVSFTPRFFCSGSTWETHIFRMNTPQEKSTDQQFYRGLLRHAEGNPLYAAIWWATRQKLTKELYFMLLEKGTATDETDGP